MVLSEFLPSFCYIWRLLQPRLFHTVFCCILLVYTAWNLKAHTCQAFVSVHTLLHEIIVQFENSIYYYSCVWRRGIEISRRKEIPRNIIWIVFLYNTKLMIRENIHTQLYSSWTKWGKSILKTVLSSSIPICLE